MRPVLKVLALTLPILVFAAFGLWLLRSTFGATTPYPEFGRLLEAGRVESVLVRGERAEVTLKPPGEQRLTVRLPDSQPSPDSDLVARLEARGVDYRFEAPGQWLGILLNLLPVALVLLVPLGLIAVLVIWLGRRSRPAQR